MKNKVFILVLGLFSGLFLPTPFLAQNTVITGFVWNDLNANGLQDSLEPGVPGVVVVLQNASATVATSATDTTGHYTFSAIAPDSLRLQFVNPGGVMPTLQNVGTNDTIDSDADANGRTNSTGVLTPGQIDLTLDMGIYSVTPTGEGQGAEPTGSFRLYLPTLRP